MKSETKSGAKGGINMELSAEQLEARLNLSTLGFHFGLDYGDAALVAVRSVQSTTKVISLTTETSTVKAAATASGAKTSKTATPTKTVAVRSKTPGSGGFVFLQPLRPPLRVRVPVVAPTVTTVVIPVVPTTPTPTSTPTPTTTITPPVSTTTSSTTPSPTSTPTTPAPTTTTTPTPISTVTTTPTSTTTPTTTTPVSTTTPITTTPVTTTTTTPVATPTPTPTPTSTVTTTPTSTTTSSTTPSPAPSPSSTVTVTATSSSPSLPSVNTPDPLAPLVAQLYGDDVHDDSGTIQQMIDTANAEGYSTITLPAGTFKLDNALNFYGSNITLTGQGASTILDVNDNFNGSSANNPYGNGVALHVAATLDTNHLMIKQAVTGNTIVFDGQAGVTAGETLFLSNGRGSTALIEAARGGGDTGPGAFNELGPDEYVQVASVSTDANGDTVATLTQDVMGTGDYGNVSPNGASSQYYLNAVSIDRPAQNLTVENFSIKFTDMNADSAMYIFYGDHVTTQNIQVLNSSSVGGRGGIGIVGSTACTFNNISEPNALGLNSSRETTVENCSVQTITLEESATDNLIEHNTITNTNNYDIRINDMACARNTFEYNTIYGGSQNTGAVAFAEGIYTVFSHNTVIGQYASIWAGLSQGDVIQDNIAPLFNNCTPSDVMTVTGNSWQ